MLYRERAPTITAVVPKPGTPSVSMGTKEPAADALLAASGAATPRMSPCPKWPSAPVKRFSIEYAMALAIAAPAPASTPTMEPGRLERTVPHQVSAISFMLNNARPVSLMMPSLLWCCSSISKISLIENTPITTTVNWMPSDKCRLSPVNQYTPEFESSPMMDSDRPITAANTAFMGASPIRPVMHAKAKHISAKYSAGPNARAQRASSGANSTMPRVANKAPMNELQAEFPVSGLLATHSLQNIDKPMIFSNSLR